MASNDKKQSDSKNQKLVKIPIESKLFDEYIAHLSSKSQSQVQAFFLAASSWKLVKFIDAQNCQKIQKVFSLKKFDTKKTFLGIANLYKKIEYDYVYLPSDPNHLLDNKFQFREMVDNNSSSDSEDEFRKKNSNGQILRDEDVFAKSKIEKVNFSATQPMPATSTSSIQLSSNDQFRNVAKKGTKLVINIQKQVTELNQFSASLQQEKTSEEYENCKESNKNDAIQENNGSENIIQMHQSSQIQEEESKQQYIKQNNEVSKLSQEQQQNDLQSKSPTTTIIEEKNNVVQQEMQQQETQNINITQPMVEQQSTQVEEGHLSNLFQTQSELEEARTAERIKELLERKKKLNAKALLDRQTCFGQNQQTQQKSTTENLNNIIDNQKEQQQMVQLSLPSQFQQDMHQNPHDPSYFMQSILTPIQKQTNNNNPSQNQNGFVKDKKITFHVSAKALKLDEKEKNFLNFEDDPSALVQKAAAIQLSKTKSQQSNNNNNNNNTNNTNNENFNENDKEKTDIGYALDQPQNSQINNQNQEDSQPKFDVMNMIDKQLKLGRAQNKEVNNDELKKQENNIMNFDIDQSKKNGYRLKVPNERSLNDDYVIKKVKKDQNPILQSSEIPQTRHQNIQQFQLPEQNPSVEVVSDGKIDNFIAQLEKEGRSTVCNICKNEERIIHADGMCRICFIGDFKRKEKIAVLSQNQDGLLPSQMQGEEFQEMLTDKITHIQAQTMNVANTSQYESKMQFQQYKEANVPKQNEKQNNFGNPFALNNKQQIAQADNKNNYQKKPQQQQFMQSKVQDQSIPPGFKRLVCGCILKRAYRNGMCSPCFKNTSGDQQDGPKKKIAKPKAKANNFMNINNPLALKAKQQQLLKFPSQSNADATTNQNQQLALEKGKAEVVSSKPIPPKVQTLMCGHTVAEFDKGVCYSCFYDLLLNDNKNAKSQVEKKIKEHIIKKTGINLSQQQQTTGTKSVVGGGGRCNDDSLSVAGSIRSVNTNISNVKPTTSQQYQVQNHIIRQQQSQSQSSQFKQQTHQIQQSQFSQPLPGMEIEVPLEAEVKKALPLCMHDEEVYAQGLCEACWNKKYRSNNNSTIKYNSAQQQQQTYGQFTHGKQPQGTEAQNELMNRGVPMFLCAHAKDEPYKKGYCKKCFFKKFASSALF